MADYFPPTIKRRKLLHSCSSQSSLSVMDRPPTDILSSMVFNRLNFNDFVQAKSVCSSWNLLGQKFVSRIPWLILPSKEQVENQGDDFNNNGYNGFLNLGENQVYKLKEIPQEFIESCCIGSSHGWLVFLGEKAVPFLFNPLTQVKIQLPSIGHLLGLSNLRRNGRGEYVLEHIDRDSLFGFKFCNKQQVRVCFVQKAILTGQPGAGCKNRNYGVILLCNKGKEIAYYESRDGSWTKLPVSHSPYQDIICHGNYLYALNESCHVTVWDLQNGSLMEKYDTPFPHNFLSKAKLYRDVCTSRLHLVKSCGELMLVVRYIGEYVDWDGTLLTEDDLLTDEWPQPKVCPYKTCLFHVHKLDTEKKQWEEMECLRDRALFLGGNQSVCVSTSSFPNCENNSIYFTDDYWERMEEDYLYGGHDMGIYNLKDGSIKPVHEFSTDKIQPPPCWIIPKAMLEEA